jgi:Effector-associated domain 10/vWA-MoxR associated protein C-terminal domain
MSDSIQRIIDGNHNDADLETLRQLLASGDSETISQLGKYNVNIKEGKDIHIGDRIYQQWDEKTIEDLVKAIQENSGIHQNTQGGDAAAGNIDKSTNIFFFLDADFKDNSQEFLRDLDFSGISQENIQQAYEDSLPPYADDWGLPGNDIKQKLQSLKQFERLPDFFDRLVRDENLSPETRDRLQSISQQLALKKSSETTKNRASPNSDVNRVEQLKSYLITTIEPYDGNFILNAWLIFHDPFQDFSSFQSQKMTRFEPLLDVNEKQAGILCKLNQLPVEFSKLLQKAVTLLRRKKYHLTIEFFLPSNLMCMEIDRWKIKINDSDEIVLGTKYPIRLRSILTITHLEFNWNQWCENWDKVRDVLKEKPADDLFEHLQEIDNFNAESFTYKLNDKIGLKLTCTHPQSMRKDLFQAIRLSTTPIAIWIRTDLSSLDRVTEIDKVLTSQPLCDLCKSVQKTRVQAHAQAEEHVGLHLALLWENPYRLTPDVMVELMQAGQ